ncbi:MAG: nitroreductase family protein [Anaerolineae bacterium]|nr:nitroreductase family protein [Anaerolineae bacterium]MDQ7034171.1 nitroreductase family protein [Anaerolineae bacterium]
MSDRQQVLSPVIEAIFERRSLRKYENRPVPHELIEQILTAGLYAPSAHNRQPWRFAVVQSFDTKKQLAQSMGARLRHDLESDSVPQAIIEKDVSRSYDRLTSAPVLIVLCVSMVDMDTYNDERRNHHEYIMAVQSTAMAGQNILLAAHDSGLGACWMCAPLFCPDVVQDTLQLPQDWQAQGIIAIGYAAQERTKTRESLETRVLWR